MKQSTLKYFLFFITSFFFSTISFSQNKPFSISVRILGQFDFQKTEYKEGRFPYVYKEHKIAVFNYGADILRETKISNKCRLSAGFGYFRNKFIQNRFYEHRLLNVGTDSLPIGTGIYNYIFHQLRVPIGVLYKVGSVKNYEIYLGLENMVNFSVTQVYNGGLPFEGANNRYSHFDYYGNSIMFSLAASKKLTKNTLLDVALYTRIWNIYKRQNPILFEYEHGYYSRFFDALGLSLKYSLGFKKKQ